jgi:hypothetical protein
MFKAFKNNKIIPEKKYTKIYYNEGKCPICNSKNHVPITYDEGSLSKCLDCNNSFKLFKYVDSSELNSIKESYNNFINYKTHKNQNVII